MTSNPLVSICIPTYNGEEYLIEALESVSSQTYKNIELIISDDASEDRTLDIVSKFKNEVNFPVFIYNHNPNGIGSNWNNCAVKAGGYYIKYLFQDDVLRSDCIEKMVDAFGLSSKVGLVYSKRNFIYDKKNKVNSEWVKDCKNLHIFWKDNKILPDIVNNGIKLLRDKNLLGYPKNKIGEPSAVIIKSEVFRKVGYFSESLNQSLDAEFWYRLMQYYNIVFIDEKLLSFRLHENQATNSNAGDYFKEKRIFEKSIYDKLFWNLHLKNKIILFIKYNYLILRVGNLLRRVFNLKSFKINI